MCSKAPKTTHWRSAFQRRCSVSSSDCPCSPRRFVLLQVQVGLSGSCPSPPSSICPGGWERPGLGESGGEKKGGREGVGVWGSRIALRLRLQTALPDSVT
ncbi:unnamed protein product [Lota lota]